MVSDSSAYLPPTLADASGIRMVSQYVRVGDSLEAEGDVDSHDFFEELRAGGEVPTTVHPPAADFSAVYDPLVDAGYDVVSVHLASALSQTCDAAREAAAAHDGRVQVFDSQSAAGGLGLIALAAARRASAGESVDGVLAAAEDARTALKLWFALDTLEFLKRGGRIGAASSLIGSTLLVKPILTIEDGSMRPVEQVRTAERAFERMVDYARQRYESGADAWVVQHVQAPDTAERLVAECREVFGSAPVFTSEIGAVVGAHSGPGLIGLGALPARLLT